MIRAAATALFALASSAHAAVLYDGSLGTPPASQGLTYIAIGPTANITAGGATLLDTNANAMTYAGFGTNAVPLDRAAGFTFRIDAQLLSESHSNAARAGFSLLVISSDLKAIEIGFHGDEVFAQAAVTSSSRGEFAPFNTFATPVRYELAVLGDNYTLNANGLPILAGPLRDYTNFGGPPYTVPNSIFLGDDSTSASAAVRFTYVSVPEPTTLAAVAGLACVAMRRRRTV